MQKHFPVHKLSVEQIPLPRAVLADLRPLPPHIYLQGTPEALSLLKRLPRDGLGVVGTRIPDAAAIRWSRQVILALRASRRVIVSGFAVGIDGMAHEAALEAGLPTIAILGTPLDRDYPSRHWGLRERLLQSGGLLWSEFEPGTEIFPHHFALRNRWIAALSQATWVVQAPEESGSLVTADWAHALGRDVYVTPAAPWEIKHRGNHELLASGALPLQGMQDLGQTWPELIGGAQLELPRSAAQRSLFVETLRSTPSGMTEDDFQKWAHEHRIPLLEWSDWLETEIQAGRIFRVEDRWLAGETNKESVVASGLRTHSKNQSLLKTSGNSD